MSDPTTACTPSTTGSTPHDDQDCRRTLDVLIVQTDGSAQPARWTTSADGSVLPQLQAAVGGLVDVVALTDDVDLWVHDEGLYACEPNPVATLLALTLGRSAPFYGPAVFTGGADEDGSTQGLDPQVHEQLVEAVQLAAADPVRLAAVTVDAVLFAARYR